MAVFQCKACGAPLSFKSGAHVVKCEYCDMLQTIDMEDGKRSVRGAIQSPRKKRTSKNEFVPQKLLKTPQMLYEMAKVHLQQAKSKEDFIAAAKLFAEIYDYRDAASLQQECLQKAQEASRVEIYDLAVSRMNGPYITSIEYAIELFTSLEDWRDCKEKITQCYANLEELKKKLEQKQEAEHKAKRKKYILRGAIAAVLIGLLLFIGTADIRRYNRAMQYMQSGSYAQAVEILQELDIRDSDTQLMHCLYRDPDCVSCLQPGAQLSFGKDLTWEYTLAWNVLCTEGTKALVLCDEGVEWLPYFEERPSDSSQLTWENSNVRRWLHEEFFQEAFSQTEQEMISPVWLENNDQGIQQPKTMDSIFLLSDQQAQLYLPVLQDLEYYREDYDERWWLRNVSEVTEIEGMDSFVYVECVRENDVTTAEEALASIMNRDVRPAMWIDFSHAQ